MALPTKAIKEIPVDFECSIHKINKEENDVGHYTLASEDGGWCVVKKSNHPNDKVGYSGLYIFRRSTSYGLPVNCFSRRFSFSTCILLFPLITNIY